MRKIDIDDPEIADLITEDQKSQLEEEIELLDGASEPSSIRSWSAKENFHRYFSDLHLRTSV